MQRTVPGRGDHEHSEGRAVLLDLHQVLTLGVNQVREDLRALPQRPLALRQQYRLLPSAGRDREGLGGCCGLCGGSGADGGGNDGRDGDRGGL